MLVFAHPHCPCSRASIHELGRLLPELRGRADVTVFFYQPEGTLDGWAYSGLWREAGSLPGATVRVDSGGHQAGLFGAATSGSAVLYDPAGRLAFQGGLTPARGHEGPADGQIAIRKLIAGEMTGTQRTPVFGCALCDEPDTEKQP
jgi:hypothetical protein